MEPLLVIILILSFFVTLTFIPNWINIAKRGGFVGKDVNKTEKTKVAEAGGICVMIGFVLGVLGYICAKIFVFKTEENTLEIFALLCSIILVSFIGFVDDLAGWKIGLTKNTRIWLLILAAFPLVAINAGESVMMGINLGVFYFLVLFIGFVGATTTFNFLAGYNGLEASQGILILSGLAIATFFTDNSWLSVICLTMVMCLSAFYIYNKYPAKVFPGDILTYSVGALIAIVAILGNIEKIAVFFFIPYIIETGLKIRGKLKKESFAKVNKDNSLEMPYDKIYGLEHLAIKLLKKIKRDKKTYEKEVVYLINLFQIMVISLGFFIFRNSIF